MRCKYLNPKASHLSAAAALKWNTCGCRTQVESVPALASRSLRAWYRTAVPAGSRYSNSAYRNEATYTASLVQTRTILLVLCKCRQTRLIFFSNTLTRGHNTAQSVVAGLAPTTLEWKNTTAKYKNKNGQQRNMITEPHHTPQTKQKERYAHVPGTGGTLYESP